MNVQKETAGVSVFWKIMERFGYHGIKMLVQIILARILLPSDFGLISIILVFIDIATTFVQSGLNTALIQNKDADDDDFSSVMWLSIFIAILLYIFLYVSAPVISAFYENTKITFLLRLMGVMLFGGAVNSIQIAYTSKRSEFKKQFMANSIAVIVSGSVSIWMAYKDFGILSLILQQLIWQYTNCIILGLSIKWRPKFIFNTKRVCKLFSFGWKMLASSLLIRLNSMLSKLIIGKKFAASDLGYYTKASGFPAAFSDVAVNAISFVALVSFSDTQDNFNNVKLTLKNYVRYSFFFISPIMLGLAAISRPMVVVLLTDKWLPSVIYLKLLCIVYLFQPICSFYGQAVSGLGRSDLYLRVFMIVKPIGIILMFIATLFLKSIIFIAVIEIVIAVLEALIQAVNVKKLLKYSYKEQLLDWFPSVISAFLMYICVSMCDKISVNDIALMFIELIIGVAAYVLFSLIFQRKTFTEFMKIIKEKVKLV